MFKHRRCSLCRAILHSIVVGEWRVYWCATCDRGPASWFGAEVTQEIP